MRGRASEALRLLRVTLSEVAGYGSRLELKIATREIRERLTDDWSCDGCCTERSSLRDQDSAKASWLHRDRRNHTRAGNWRQHRDLHALERGHLQAIAGHQTAGTRPLQRYKRRRHFDWRSRKRALAPLFLCVLP